MPTINHLPYELIVLIGENLKKAGDVNALAQTSTYYSQALTPRLNEFAADPEHATLALHWAAATSNESLLRFILNNSTGIHTIGDNTRVLHVTPDPCPNRTVNLILQRGAALTVTSPGPGPRPLSSLHTLVRRENAGALKYLLRLGAPASMDPSLLHYCAPWDDAPIALLAASGASLTFVLGGRTPLRMAIACHNVKVTAKLIAVGADVNVRDEEGNTPLYAAVALNDVELVMLLVKNGADANIKNRFGRSAVDEAWQWGNGCIRWLLMNDTDRDFLDRRWRMGVRGTGSGDWI